MKIAAIVPTLFLVSCFNASARLTRIYSFDELVKMSDVVVVIRIVSNQANNALIVPEQKPADPVQGNLTTAKVVGTFKGNEIEEEIKIQTFYFKKEYDDFGGADLIKLPDPNIGFRFATLIGGEIGTTRESRIPPEILAFLKKSPDGTYVPSTGQLEAGQSFKALLGSIFGNKEYHDR